MTTLLIIIAVVALLVWLIIWVLGQIGVPLPAQVVKIIWVIFALIVVLILLKALLPAAGIRLP